MERKKTVPPPICIYMAVCPFNVFGIMLFKHVLEKVIRRFRIEKDRVMDIAISMSSKILGIAFLPYDLVPKIISSENLIH